MKKAIVKFSFLPLLMCSLSSCSEEHTANVKPKILTYDGTAQELLSEEFNNVTGRFCYSLDGTNFSFDIPKATDAGVYQISFFYVGSDYYKNYSNISAVREVNYVVSTIEKRDITEGMFIDPVSADSETIDTDVALFKPGSCEFGTFYYSLDKTNWTKDMLYANSPNEYTLYWYIKGDNNHNDFASQNAPKELKCQVYDNRSLTFLPFVNSNDKIKTYRFHDTYSGSDTYSNDAQFSFEFLDLVSLDNNTYNKNLASLGLVLTAELYDYISVDRKIDDQYSQDAFISTLGVKDITLCSVNADDYETDKNDVATVELSHTEFLHENNSYQEFFITFKGTDKNEEWASNFDIGYDCENYVSTTKRHTDWVHKNYHKGFDVAFNRIRDLIDNYINFYKSKTATIILFISGHSRGGALANLAGAKYSNYDEYKTFTYTFAAPFVTDEETISDYKNIFNVINSDDLISNIPPQSLGFKRYGHDVVYKVSSNKAAANDFLNKNYSSIDVNGLLDVLGEVFDSRESLYNMPEDYDDELAVNKYDSEEKALQGKEEMFEILGEIYDRGNIIISDPIFENDRWYIKWKYSKAFILDAIGDLLVAESFISRIGVLLFIPTPVNTFGTQLITLMTDSSGVSCAHLPDSYAIVVNNN